MDASARAAMLLVMSTTASTLLPACGHSKRSPFVSAATTTPREHDAGVVDAGAVFHVPPPPLPAQDAPGVCGRTVVPIAADPVNLYFVLDASASMTLPMVDLTTGIVPVSRYDAAEAAIRDVLMRVGYRVSYGLTVFPSDDSTNSCPVGHELLATSPGDDVSYTAGGKIGPRLKGLLDGLDFWQPTGLTPTAASIAALEPELLALHGKTYAFLLTDGAPNCDAERPCDASNCTINIEGGCGLAKGANCCDPNSSPYDSRWCLDGDPTVAAVADLAKNGIETFVIGMPGTEAYASLLDRIATAGGTARSAEPLYYPVETPSDLSSTLEDLGLSVAISCDVSLAEAPPEPDQVNVYFDQTAVPLDDTAGWKWTSDTSISITGRYCSDLQTGQVLEIQVVAGCPTITR